MSRYVVVGRPFSPPLESLLAGCRVGDVVDLDDEQGRMLAGAGAVRAAGEPKLKGERPKPKAGTA